MIPRTIYPQILQAIKEKPVVIITGARQVGKTTLCTKIEEEEGFSYLSLADPVLRESALADPAEFLALHPAPLIIDEIQKAPVLFDYIEGEVDKKKRQGVSSRLYILTGSEAYKLSKGVSESMRGRVAFIHMSPLSLSELQGKEERPFLLFPAEANKRAKEYPCSTPDLYKTIVRGLYPELYDNPSLNASTFYADYLESYMTKDVSDVVQLRDRSKFLNLMTLLASLTGQELNYSTLAKSIGLDVKTIQGYVSILEAGNIIHLLSPYNENSIVKQLVHRPKIYFVDTGLACYLARIASAETLIASYLKGSMVETFFVNELLKSYRNNRKDHEAAFYYYRDSKQHEVDFVLLRDGALTLLECKAGVSYALSDVSSFKQFDRSVYRIAGKAIICTCPEVYPLGNGTYAIPFTSI